MQQLSFLGKFRHNTHIISDKPTARAAKSLNGKRLSFFHLGLVAALDNGDALAVGASVDRVLANRVSVQVADRFYRVCRTVQLDFVALHCLLNGCSDVTHADIDTRFL